MTEMFNPNAPAIEFGGINSHANSSDGPTVIRADDGGDKMGNP